ncbi:MAG: hypothetical protein ACP5O7_03935 [Phycisphaerae bacterium]
MKQGTDAQRDSDYLEIIRSSLRICLDYKPAFGQGRHGGITLNQFQQLYQQDEFYAWFGLDSPLVYKAHKVSGGMTSIYRQVGMACQLLFSRILQDALGISTADAQWSYQIPAGKGKSRKLSLDGRIPLAALATTQSRSAVQSWLGEAATRLGVEKRIAAGLDGAVFEVRQGYKSNDAKRQNADVANASSAYMYRYLPVMVVFSVQIPTPLAERYQRARWLILRGTSHGSSVDSTYVFCREILGYNLGAFFKRNSSAIKQETMSVFKGLLQ